MKRSFFSLLACLVAVAMIGCGRTPETAPPQAEAPAKPSAPKPVHASYSLEWISNDVPPTMAVGKSVPVKVSVKNTGDWAWNDPHTANPSQPDGTYAVRLVYNWVDADQKPLPANVTRGELTAPVPPGQTANFTINVAAPKSPGNYQLQLDLVEELVFFFSSKGNEKLTVPVTVQ
jgi:hypothetical protein